MSKPEPDQPDAPASTSGFSRVVLAVVILLLLYALSIGPVLKFSGRNPPPAVGTIYAPLEYLINHVSVVRHFYVWYLGLWGFK
jgi:hypothetical protein